MSPEQAEKIVREACIKAVPSLMELEFGQQVMHMPDGRVFTFMYGDMKGDIGIWGAAGFKKDEGKFYKVLGKDPSFADVLFVIGARYPKCQYESDRGKIILSSSFIPYGQKQVTWEPLFLLSGQSPETKLFLASLMGEK